MLAVLSAGSFVLQNMLYGTPGSDCNYIKLATDWDNAPVDWSSYICPPPPSPQPPVQPPGAPPPPAQPPGVFLDLDGLTAAVKEHCSSPDLTSHGDIDGWDVSLVTTFRNLPVSTALQPKYWQLGYKPGDHFLGAPFRPFPREI